MKGHKPMKTTTNIIYVAFALLLASFALLPQMQAVVPAPDGGYPGANTAEGQSALQSLTSGIWNTALGYQALYHETTGNYNTADGMRALFSNTTGHHDTATGVQALYSNTTGNFNTANGVNALLHNTTGQNTALGYQTLYNTDTVGFNTAVGSQALFKNISGVADAFGDPPPGQQNTAVGYQALYNNTSGPADQYGSTGGEQNTGIGYQALFTNTTGWPNTAVGSQPLFNNTIGEDNVGIGYQPLFHNTVGFGNVAVGDFALQSNTVGRVNTAIGFLALRNNLNCDDPGCTEGGSANTAVGAQALESLTTGGGNIAIGDAALINHTTGNQNIAIGLRAGQNLTNGGVNVYIANQGVPSESRTIRIGNVVTWTDIYGFGHPFHTATYIAGIDGQATDAASTVPVVIDVTGKLGTVASSERFKHDIKAMDSSSDALLALKPVTFHYKNDAKNTPQFGLVAEEVAKVNPDLVVRDAKGEIYTVRYDAVNAMLLNEFPKEHQTVQELKTTVAQQKQQIEALTAAVQKVSAQLELNKSTAQTVLNDQ